MDVPEFRASVKWGTAEPNYDPDPEFSKITIMVKNKIINRSKKLYLYE